MESQQEIKWIMKCKLDYIVEGFYWDIAGHCHPFSFLLCCIARTRQAAARLA